MSGRKLTRPHFLYLCPEKEQARNVAWDEFKNFLEPIPGMHFDNNRLVITFPNQAKIYLNGADDPHRLRGMYFDGVVLDEYAQMPSVLWDEVLRPALSDRRGWAIFIGTVRGEDKFWEKYNYAKTGRDPNWFGKLFKASDTGYVPEAELIEAKRSMTIAAFKQEYECDPTAALKGAYYAEVFDYLDKENKINDKIDHDPGKVCYTAWDLGMNDKTCIWFIEQGEEHWRVIDYYENSGKDLTHYANVVKSKPYVYQKHILPHDAAQRSLSTGLTRKQQLAKLGLKCSIAKKVGVNDGINATISILYKCKFNSVKCKEGLNAMRQYRAEYNDKLEVFKPTPLHNWASHAADAFRYFATGVKKSMKKKPQTGLDSDYDPFSRRVFQRSKDYDPFNN